MSIKHKLILESFKENSMLMNIPTEDMNLIISGEKTVIVQTKVPSESVTQTVILYNRQVKVYLYNKVKGVFGECSCCLSFNNDMNKKQIWAFPYCVGNITKKSHYYIENADKYLDMIRRENRDINLNGTCLEYDEFVNLVTIGKFIFFIIRELTIYETPLKLDDFYMARGGKHGSFSPSDKFKAPRGWCYALKKSDIFE